jgi:hypothetical protein
MYKTKEKLKARSETHYDCSIFVLLFMRMSSHLNAHIL